MFKTFTTVYFLNKYFFRVHNHFRWTFLHYFDKIGNFGHLHTGGLNGGQDLAFGHGLHGLHVIVGQLMWLAETKLCDEKKNIFYFILKSHKIF